MLGCAVAVILSASCFVNRTPTVVSRFHIRRQEAITSLRISRHHDDVNVDEDRDVGQDSTRRNLLVAVSSATSSVLLLVQDPLPSAAAYTDEEARRIAVFEKTSPSVVFIDTFTERRDVFSTNIMEVPLGSGSGFVWDTDGHIVTNFHVVRNAATAQVAILTTSGNNNINPNNNNNNLLSSSKSVPSKGGRRIGQSIPSSMLSNSALSGGRQQRSVFQATVVGVDPAKDVAVLKVDAPKALLKPIMVGSSTNLKVGQQALAIGNPFGLDHTLTSGIISGTGRQVNSPIGRPITNVIQTDAAINPGNSGGPLLDSNGKLIGMNTAIYSPSGGSAGIGFAIPISTISVIVKTLIRDGQVIRPIIGITFLESRQAKALGIGSGVLVLEVPPGSAAAAAGLKGTRRTEDGLIEIGDIITKIGNAEIDTETDLFQALETYKPGDLVKITVTRASAQGDELTVNVLELQVKLQSSVDLQEGIPKLQYRTQ